MPRKRNRTGRPVCVAIAALLLLCCATSSTLAKVQIAVDIGWENKFRAGKWTPLFITLQDSSPRQIILEVYSPADRRYALNIQQGLTIGPQPVVVPVYAPLSYRLDETTITVRDARSLRRLEHLIVNDFPLYGNQPGPQVVSGQDPFIVISGSSEGERSIQAQLRHQNVSTAFVAANRLPITPMGYESIDVLLLNQPAIARLNVEQQGAMAAWVRAGGMLVLVPGSDPPPAIGPLVEILPARIGAIRQLDLDPAIVKKAGLPARFAKLKGRDLTDVAPDARTTPLFDPAGPKAVRRWVGLGQVMLLPVEVGGLAFDKEGDAIAFWRATLKGLIEIPTTVDPNSRNVYYGMSDDPRRVVAIRQTLDWIGDVPGAGSFGFSYVAIVLIVMMFIVGPVDWIVLKWLGKQPWTWVTITGWIGLVTLGSIYIGHIFKSGDVHFRTASVIDEAGGARVASLDLAGIYSPRTTDYDLEMRPYSWWRTASLTNPYGGSNMLTEIRCHQDYRGNRPLPMLINVWNCRFIEGHEIGDEPPMIQAQLALAAGRRMTGSVTNRAPFPLSEVIIRTRDGVTRIAGPIEPGATAQVDASIVKDKSLVATTQVNQQEQWQLYTQDVPTTQPTPQSINGVADLRAIRIDQQLAERDDVACVYATYSAAPGDRLKINNVADPKTAHMGVIRAMVPVKK